MFSHHLLSSQKFYQLHIARKPSKQLPIIIAFDPSVRCLLLCNVPNSFSVMEKIQCRLGLQMLNLVYISCLFRLNQEIPIHFVDVVSLLTRPFEVYFRRSSVLIRIPSSIQPLCFLTFIVHSTHRRIALASGIIILKLKQLRYHVHLHPLSFH